MRIVYIHQYFRTPSNPGGSRSYEAARRLAERGHDVHVIASSSIHNRKCSEKIDNITVHWLPVPYSQLMSHKERIRAFLSFAGQAARAARSVRGDLVFASSTPLTVAIPGILATVFRNSPLVFEVRDLWPDVPIAMGALKSAPIRMLAQMLEKITYRYSAHIVALSPDMKNAITAKGIAPDKVSVIPNASDNEFFESRSSSVQGFREAHPWLRGHKIVLYCGTLGRVNDVSYIARLAAATREISSDIYFLIVGTGNDEDNVRRTARQLGVHEQNFFIMEPVARNEVPKIFEAADLSMSTVAPMPILSANSANKVFDTFASGTPLAINHGGWLSEVLIETGAGLILDASNSDLAARQLVEFLGSERKLKNAAAQAKKLALQRFDRQIITDRLINILERVQSSQERRPVKA